MYLYEAALAFRMIDAVWVIFLLERGFSLVQVGIAEGVYHVTSMICEVPSGMAADLFGRKRTLILSGIVGICSAIFMTLEGWAGFVYCSMVLSALSLNLASGTEEALVYDSLLEAGCEENFKKQWADMSLIARTASALACAASPVAIMLGYKYTYYISALLYLCTIFAVVGVKEPVVTKRQEIRSTHKERNRGKNGRRENGRNENESGKIDKCQFLSKRYVWGTGLKRHIVETAGFIKDHPRTMAKLFANAALASPCYLTMMYLQEHLVNCGWPKSFIGIPMLVIPLAGALGTRIAVKNKESLPKALFICGIISGIGTCLAGSSALIIVIFGACVVRICEGFAEIAVSENVNREFTSDHRATLVSVDSMCYSVLMVAASPLTGFVGEYHSVNAAFYLLGGGLLLGTAAAGIVCRRYYRKRKHFRF